jgi:hypothetical protein
VVLSGVLNALGWGIVIVYLFFAGGSGYLLLQRRRSGLAHVQSEA